jgi:hypothetical protein
MQIRGAEPGYRGKEFSEQDEVCGQRNKRGMDAGEYGHNTRHKLQKQAGSGRVEQICLRQESFWMENIKF